MAALPWIHAAVPVPDFSATGAYGHFGFYDGVTNTAARVEQAYRERGLSGVEALLRQNR